MSKYKVMSDEKRFPISEKKREELQDKGIFVKAPEVPAFGAFLGFLLLAQQLFSSFFDVSLDWLAKAKDTVSFSPSENSGLLEIMQDNGLVEILNSYFLLTAKIGIIVFALATLACLLQSKFKLSRQSMFLSPSEWSVLSCSVRRVVWFILRFALLGAAIYLSFLFIEANIESFSLRAPFETGKGLAQTEVQEIVFKHLSGLFSLSSVLILVLFLLTVFSWLRSLVLFEKDHLMTRVEYEEELKEDSSSSLITDYRYND